MVKREAVTSYSTAVGSGSSPRCLNGEKRVVQTRRLALLLKIGEMGLTAWDYDEAPVTEERKDCNGDTRLQWAR